MYYLFARFNEIKKLLCDKFVLLLLDYDGTLTPIAETPQKAIIPPEAKELLEKLSESSCCKVAIISGRSLEDIKKAVAIQDIIYAGNHGLEIEGPNIKFENQVSPRLKGVIRHITEDLVKRLSVINGAIIEDKGLTVSVHYRLVAEKDIQDFLSIFNEIINPYISRNEINVDAGKKVYEVKPPVQWDKGKVALWLMAREQFAMGGKEVFPVYIGDDVTDEDAFKALKRKGLTIFVGESRSSSADYYLKNIKEVTKFLHLISEINHS